MTDIVERLRNWEQVDIVDAHEDGALYNAAADEIEVLMRCLNIAAGYISATSGYTHMHPQQVADMIRNAVITGDENDD